MKPTEVKLNMEIKLKNQRINLKEVIRLIENIEKNFKHECSDNIKDIFYCNATYEKDVRVPHQIFIFKFEFAFFF